MDLLFRTDEAALADTTGSRLYELATTLAAMPGIRVQLDGFADELHDLFPGFPGNGTAWQVWRVGAVTLRAFFYDNCIFHSLIILQTRLFEDIFKRANWNLNPGFARHCHCSWLHFMTKLPVTAFHAYLFPPILPQLFKDISYFHLQSLNHAA